MKHKRHNYKNLQLIFFIITICFYFVSCSTYISLNNEKLLSQANDSAINKDYDLSIDIYNKILKKDNLNQKALYNKAIVLYEKGNTQEALKTLNSLIKINKYNEKAYLFKIKIYTEIKDIDSAIEEYQKIIKITPNNYSIRNEFITLLLDNFDNTDAFYSKLIKENSLFLIERNKNISLAAKALCIIEKNNAEYSALLYLNDKKIWEEIYSSN